MKFKSLLDYKVFLASVQNNVTDAILLRKLRGNRTYTVEDDIYWKLTDDLLSYTEELQFNSKRKTFYKTLSTVDNLTVEELPALHSLLTHIAIGLNNRCEIRKSVPADTYMYFVSTVDSIINDILREGEVPNTLKDIL